MTFIPSKDFEGQLKADDSTHAVLVAAAKAAVPAAKAAAPGSTGADIKANGTALILDHEAGTIIEFGSRNNPPYAPLRRGAETFGARYVDDA